VADAIAACDDYLLELCDALVACSPGLTVESCVDEIEQAGLDCSCAVEVESSQVPVCYEAIDTATCDELAEDNVPDACDGLIGIRC
jgi:hypothetical protein